MKIYSRKDFLELPDGIFFSKGVKWCFDGFCIKVATLKDRFGANVDFFYQDLFDCNTQGYEDFSDGFDEMLHKGISLPLHLCSQKRDGMFNDDDCFMVFEKGDLMHIKSMIEMFYQDTEGT
jgi:hypothetical protein